MKIPVYCLLGICLAWVVGCGKIVLNENEPASDILEKKKEGVVLVENGEGKTIIVLSENASEMELEAAGHFQKYIEKASGVHLEIKREGEEWEEGVVPVYIGATEALKQLGVNLEELEEETYGIKVSHQGVFLFGRDAGFGRNVMVDDKMLSSTHWSAYRTPATTWAVNHIVEEAIGVRWLWPGALGTFIPEKSTIVIALQDEMRRPLLERRSYMAKGRLVLHDKKQPSYVVDLETQAHLQKEAREWLENHQAGNRTDIYYGHSFNDWWEKYSASHPDLFALPPSPDIKQPFPNEHRVKLRLANPAVLDFIEKEYLEAGKPDTWAVTPNDGSGFDTSSETAAWDIPAGQDKLLVWQAKGELTARYIRFWNLVHERLKKHNPDVRLSTLAYSCYRQPPTPETPVTAELIVGIVHGYKDSAAYASWKGWSDQGAKMVLRPNWWHAGVHAPYLEPRAQADYIKFAFENRMIAFSKDTLMGYWATQGLTYYVVARTVANPQLEVEDIISEYTSAFGSAENKIREYLEYWMEVSQKINFAGAVSIHSSETSEQSSLYQEMATRHGFGRSILTGSFRGIPYLYEDEILNPAEQLLKEAYELAAADVENPEVRKRVEFLQSGLQEFRLTRDILKLGYAIKEEGKKEWLPEFQKMEKQLHALRTQLTLTHALWAESVYTNEVRRKIPTSSASLPELTENMDGL